MGTLTKMESKCDSIEAESLDKIKNDFLTIIGHEIRTALNGISGPIDLLKSNLDKEKSSSLINILDISVSRLERFSIAALNITELKSNKRPLNKTIFKLITLIKETTEGIDELLKPKGLTLHIYPIPDEQMICGDRRLLTVCLENIIENAIRHSPNAGTIFIHSFERSGELICEITDFGGGFSDHAMGNLFGLFVPGEPYFDNNLGLNLTLSSLIMEAHSGRIEVANINGGGALVRLVFPSAN